MERPHQGDRRHVAGPFQRPFDPLAPLTVETPTEPEPIEHGAESKQRIDLVVLVEPGEREAHVVMFGGHLGQSLQVHEE